MHPLVDIPEDDILRRSPRLLLLLLKDHTVSRARRRYCPITWATHDYAPLGPGYQYADPITPALITGPRGRIIQPRTLKARDVQQRRARERAEVYTPAWVCNAQNNLVDEAWGGKPDIFNTEHTDHTWTPAPAPVRLPEGHTWQEYVALTRLEITCGEAPYLVSRYDAATGRYIPLAERIGLLDRKLRLVSEHCTTSAQWLRWARRAYQSTYGYEWQGDSLLLAREALLMTFVEYFQARFGRLPLLRSLLSVAYIISWNLWQMDGLRGVVPDTCRATPLPDLFGRAGLRPCPGCQSGDIARHNGLRCLIRDWTRPRARQVEPFIATIY